jgi:hypothetical protein
MAITGAAAIVGIGATAAGVSATVVAVAGLAITAVGMITGNKVLSKIGGGIGLGGTAAGLYNAATAATTTVADAAAQAPTVADAAGAGGQAAGNVAESNLAAATSGAVDSGSGVISSALDSGAAGVQTAAEAATTGSGAPLGFGGTGGVTSVAPVDAALNTGAATDVGTSLASQSPAQQAIQGSLANTNPANVNPANVNAANVNPANAASAASTSTPGDLMSTYTGMSANGGTGLQSSSSWWNSVDKWWQHLSPTGQLAVGQTAAGLVSGIGKGALDMMAAGKQGEATDVQKWEMANMSGAGSVPTVNMKPSGATNVYKSPAQVQAAAQAAAQTTTPAFTGLVKKNLGSA